MLFCGMDKIIDKSEQQKERRRQWLRIGAWAVGIGAVVTVSVIWFGGKSVKRSDLSFGTAGHGPLETAVAATGRIVPAVEEIVISPVSSRILAVYAQAGDSVREGMPLLQLDLEKAESQYQNLRDNYQIKANGLEQLKLANRTTLSELDMQVQIKEMEVNRLTIEVDNELRLDSLGSGTGDRVRQAQTALATGKLELKGLRQKLVNERERLNNLEAATALEVGNSARDLDMMGRTLSQGRIPAPLDGIITYLSNSIGSTVAAGERVAVVGDLSRFKVAGEVPEGSSYKVRTGADVKVRVGNTEMSGTVANVEPQSTSGAVPFTVTLDDAASSRLRPGLRVQLYVGYGFKDDVLRIPNGSYYEGPGVYTLFIADGDDRLVRRNVKLADSNREWVEVVEGLRDGDSVVLVDMSSYEKYNSLKIK